MKTSSVKWRLFRPGLNVLESIKTPSHREYSVMHQFPQAYVHQGSNHSVLPVGLRVSSTHCCIQAPVPLTIFRSNSKEIYRNFGMLLLISCATDHNGISHTSRQCHCCDVCKIPLWSVQYILNQTTSNFDQISNSIEITLTVSGTGTRSTNADNLGTGLHWGGDTLTIMIRSPLSDITIPNVSLPRYVFEDAAKYGDRKAFVSDKSLVCDR